MLHADFLHELPSSESSNEKRNSKENSKSTSRISCSHMYIYLSQSGSAWNLIFASQASPMAPWGVTWAARIEISPAALGAGSPDSLLASLASLNNLTVDRITALTAAVVVHSTISSTTVEHVVFHQYSYFQSRSSFKQRVSTDHAITWFRWRTPFGALLITENLEQPGTAQPQLTCLLTHATLRS